MESAFVALLSHLISKMSMYFRNPKMLSFMSTSTTWVC